MRATGALVVVLALASGPSLADDASRSASRSASQSASESASELARPVLTRTWIAGPSLTANGDIVVTCRAYEKFAVVEKNDPASMGREVAVRERLPGMSSDALCAKDKNASLAEHALSATAWRNAALVVDGVHGRWLVLTGADSFGIETDVAFVDAKTGRVAWQGMRFTDTPLHFVDDGARTAVTFVRSVTALKPADFTPKTKCAPGDLVGAPSRIDDLDKPAIHTVAGIDAACSPAP